MTNTPFNKAAMAKAALELLPPLIRKSLLNEQTFREDCGLKTEAVIGFGDSGVSLQRSIFFDAVRAVLSGTVEVDVSDADGGAWKLRNETGEETLPKLVLVAAEQRLVLPDFWVLSEDPSTRIRSLEEAASDANLPLDAQENWRGILAERALEDDEVDTFYSDIQDTPVHVERSIRGEITAGKAAPRLLCLIRGDTMRGW